MAKLDITGHKYNHLTVLSFSHYCEVVEKTYWNCVCDCGNVVCIRSNSLRTGHIKSCGCIKSPNLRKLRLKHGESVNSKEYNAWAKLKDRCRRTTDRAYKNYGGRGITVCDRWLESYSNFLKDMGRAPSADHSIDRIDVNGNYEPSNCRWATKQEQVLNRRNTLYILTNDGEIPFLTYCKQNNLNYNSTKKRIRKTLFNKMMCIFILAALIISCSPEQKLRRAKRLIESAERDGVVFASDTTWRTLEIPIPETKVDSVVKVVHWTDTIRVEHDRVKTAVVVTPEKKIVYIRSECLPDTVRIEVPISVYKGITIEGEKPTFWQKLKDIGQKIAAALFFIVLGAILAKMFWK